ncbi:MAG: DUF1573 domain-containing protein [Planctomycetota bacterium]|nr:DUF1573 domain-containing protein [Planctomycetaceae bacterium]MDQ3332091.1 DUF1573 domain-containing protein [Planctomycetota bacterium]
MHDFGEQRQGEELAHTFSLVNQGDAPVKIDGLTTSCHCVVAGDDELGPMTIAAGARFPLPVRFTTGTAQVTASGRVTVSYHEARDGSAAPGQRGSLTLGVRADIIPDYRVSPSEVNFGVIDGLAVQRVSRTFRVVPEAATDVEISEATSSSSFLTAEILPKRPNDSDVEIKVDLDLSRFTQSKSLSGSIILSSDSERVPKSSVPVLAKYKAPAEARPAMIVVGSDEVGEVSREIKVTTSRPARIRDVRSTAADDGVRTERDDRQSASEHRLKVFIAPRRETALDGDLEIELEFLADGGESVVRTLRVPVHRLLEKGDADE